MTPAEVRDVVLHTVETIGEVPGEMLRARSDADIVRQLGVDSIKMMRVWAEIEEQCGLEPGDLGFTQVTTVSGLVDQVLEQRNGA